MATEDDRITGCSPFAVPLTVLHVQGLASSAQMEFVGRLAEHQISGGWDVHIAGPVDLGMPGVTWHRVSLDSARPHRIAQSVRRLKQIVAVTCPDTVVLHSDRAGVVGRLAVRGRRATVFMPQTWSFRTVPRVYRPFAAVWERFAARWTSVVLLTADEDAGAGIRARVWIPPFVVVLTATLPRSSFAHHDHAVDNDTALDRVAAVIQRAHVFGCSAGRATVSAEL